MNEERKIIMKKYVTTGLLAAILAVTATTAMVSAETVDADADVMAISDTAYEETTELGAEVGTDVEDGAADTDVADTDVADTDVADTDVADTDVSDTDVADGAVDTDVNEDAVDADGNVTITEEDKGSPDTGVEGVAAIAGIAIVASGALVLSKKKTDK